MISRKSSSPERLQRSSVSVWHTAKVHNGLFAQFIAERITCARKARYYHTIAGISILSPLCSRHFQDALEAHQQTSEIDNGGNPFGSLEDRLQIGERLQEVADFSGEP